MIKKIITGFVTAAFLCGFHSAVQASSLTLTGTIRDFSAAHQDFETPLSKYGVFPGIVQNTLGGNGNPVWNTGSAELAAAQAVNHVSNETNFNQWFNDVPGVNQSMPYSIVLGEIGDTGVYRYSDTTFFPIDGLLGGNEGRSHNYHFTYEVHSSFVYDDSIARFFTFTGDDDVWVFINNQKVIDLGGVHLPATQTVNLSTLTLVDGQTYSFDFFFAERHTSMSQFEIVTNIPVTDPVPEPATMLLFGAGLAGMAGASLRRKK